jgi:hypothetical protein
MIHVTGPREPRDAHPGVTVVNTTSRAVGWERGLSPFFLGPVPLYEGAVVEQATTVENAWQFAKVYARHIGSDGNPIAEYFAWAREGWRMRRAIRYPMGKDAVAAYSWWAGERLSYIEARRRIYVPAYTRAVIDSPAMRQLLALYKEQGELVLWDFDGYDHRKLGLTYKEVLADPTRKMGHAFVLAMLLEQLVVR